MHTTFTSRLQKFNASYITPYISKALNAGASLALGNEVLIMHKTVANAELKVLKQILAQAPQVEWTGWSARPEKNARQLAFKMPIDAHKHRRKSPDLHSYSAQNKPSTTM